MDLTVEEEMNGLQGMIDPLGMIDCQEMIGQGTTVVDEKIEMTGVPTDTETETGRDLTTMIAAVAIGLVVEVGVRGEIERGTELGKGIRWIEIVTFIADNLMDRLMAERLLLQGVIIA